MPTDINNIIKKIKENIETTAFFVGAGISKNSGLPDFVEFNKKILQLTTESEQNKIIESLRPEVILQSMKDELGINSMSCLEIFRDDSLNPNLNHIVLSMMLRMGARVITTNWDDLIEKACRNNDIPYRVIHTEEQYKEIMNKKPWNFSNRPVHIFKIHGDIERKNTEFVFDSIKMTLNDCRDWTEQVEDKIFGFCTNKLESMFYRL